VSDSAVERCWIVAAGDDYGGTHPVAVRGDAASAKQRALEEVPDGVEVEEYNREDGSYLARWRNSEIVETREVDDVEC